MSKTGKKDGFILQAGILATAGIICRIIGLLYRSPLTAIIGDRGNGYYSSAFNIYTIILLISSYSIPSAISKVIAQKLSDKEYRNAHRVFICALWYVLVVGGAASIFLFFGAPLLLEGPAATVLKVFAPTIFLYGILGVLRGYFQAHRTMVQTSVSQILEQMMNALISIGAALWLISALLGSADYYVLEKDGQVTFGGEVVVEQAQTMLDETGAILLDEEGLPVYVLSEEQEEWNTKHATYGAIGSAMGTGAGVLTALLFMWAIYLLNQKTFQKRIRRDDSGPVESYGQIFKTLTSVVLPFIMSTAIYNLSTSMNQTIYTKIAMHFNQVSEKDTFTSYGIFAGKAIVIRNIPIALASAMSSAVLPSISTAWAKEEYEDARDKVYRAIKVTMLISIPAGVGLIVLARPVMQFLFPQKESLETASGILMALGMSVLFYALSTVTNSVLQGIGKVNVPVKNAAVALLLQGITLTGLLLFTNLDLYGLVIAECLYSVVICLLNQRALSKYMKYKQEIFTTFFIPLLASALMGAFSWAIYQGIYLFIESNIVCLIVAVIFAVMIYFVLVILMKGMTEDELRAIPKGYLLVKVAKKLKMM